MRVNDKLYDINKLLKQVDTSNLNLKKIGNLMLTNEEIEILDRNLVDYMSCGNLKDLIYKIDWLINDNILDSDDADELEYVLDKISERNYYENTRK